MKKRVALVNAAYDRADMSMPRAGCFPPLALLALGSYLTGNMPDVEVDIVDGDVLGQQTVLERVADSGASVVGVSPHVLNYQNSVDVGRLSKSLGATVVFGGHHVSMLSRQVISQRVMRERSVDYVVTGDGEAAFHGIVCRHNVSGLPNVGYIDAHGSAVLPSELGVLDVNAVPHPDYGLLSDLQLYWDNFENRYTAKGHVPASMKRTGSVYSQRGCPHADRSRSGRNCLFCSRTTPIWRARRPRDVWSEIAVLTREFGVDLVWDVSDTFTHEKDWFFEFCEYKDNPDLAGVDPRFLLYVRPDDACDESVVEHLSRLNCFEAFVGFESGDPTMLARSLKGTTIDHNVKAARLLKDYGIRILPSFVLGLPGETDETLGHTISLARAICENGNVHEISCSILAPLPGSSAFELLASRMRERGNPKYDESDCYDLAQAQRDWVSQNCVASFDAVVDASRLILSLGKIPSSFDPVAQVGGA